jgi:hypothetical protein
MHFQLFSLPLLVGGVLARSLGNITAPGKPDPCGIITSMITDFSSDPSSMYLLQRKFASDSSTDSGKNFLFSPELGIKCLRSSTIDTKLASNYAKELKKYYEFQSTLTYLKGMPTS